MKRSISLVLAVILAVSALFCVTSCSDKQKLNFGKELLAVTSQLDALNGLKKGDADVAVIDSVMAGYYMNGTDEFKDYQILDNVVFVEEQYGIAAKKGNDALMSKINEALIALVATDYATVAETYGLTSELLVKADTTNPLASATDGSWDKVVTDKKLIVGYTLFAPIAYKDGDGADANLIGFDIDLAKAVVNYLNTTYSAEIAIEFVVIDWNQKEALLENGSIDLVWNGMTITDERLANMCVSVPYLANKQVAVVSKTMASEINVANYDEFVTKAAEYVIIVEKGSAGESMVVPTEDK